MPDEIDLLRMFRDETPGPSTDAWARARAAVAAAGSEQIAARSRNVKRPGWRRRMPLVLASGAVAAVAALLAVLLTGPPGGGTGREEQIQTDAYIARVEHALASQAGGGLVGYARTVSAPGTVVEPELGNWKTWPGGAGSPRSGLAAAEMVSWTYQNEAAMTALGAAGQPVATEQNTSGRHGLTTVTVDYRDRTWWRATQAPLAPPPGHRIPVQQRCPSTGVLPGSETWQSFIRQELSCGAYTEDGRQRVDGIDAIKLTGGNGVVNGVVLWIDPATYLPVRQADPGARVTDYRWYRATPASLAHLKVTVPAGFRQVAPPRP
jgi:hypothetical protein